MGCARGGQRRCGWLDPGVDWVPQPRRSARGSASRAPARVACAGDPSAPRNHTRRTVRATLPDRADPAWWCRRFRLRPIDRAAPPWAAGYMIPSLRLGAVRLAQASQYPYGTLESALAHEATHMLLHDAVG